MTDRFAEFVEASAFEQLPGPVVVRTKEIVCDGLGALLSATSERYDIGRIIGRFIAESGGTPEAQVFGTTLRTNSAFAALANGTFGYYCDIESIHPKSIMHATAIVTPAALAVGERQHSSGKDVLLAIVVGIDVACRVSCALNAAALYSRGFHPSSVAGTFGAMAAAGRLLGLKGPALRNAFGLAGTETSGLLAWVSDATEHSRPFNMGLAAGHGVVAAHLAACGFGGPTAIFEGKFPLSHAFTGQWDAEELFKDLGERFRVMELCCKRFACCGFMHPGLDGLMDIQTSERIHARDIQHITLRFPKSGYKVIDNNVLRSHCAQYVLALAASTRRVHFSDILKDRRNEKEIQSLANRIDVIGDDELDRTYPELYRTIIEVKTHRGSSYVRDVTHPRGSPEQPFTSEELRQKFCDLTADILSPSRAEAIQQSVERLDDSPNIESLSKLLAKDPSHSPMSSA